MSFHILLPFNTPSLTSLGVYRRHTAHTKRVQLTARVASPKGGPLRS